ncbi:MAG TPA: M3 family metallopeptidase, partial [Cellvibrionaceae bacterium]
MTDATPNPLLQDTELPPFAAILPEHVEPAVAQLIAENREHMTALLSGLQAPTWASLVLPLEEQDDRLEKAWAPVSHLHGVVNSPELREAYTASLASITEYSTEMGQNQALYKAWCALAEGDNYQRLNSTQRKVIDNTLRDFRLSGVALEGEPKQRYARIAQRLSELSTQFSNNVLDATGAWYKHITDADALKGLPESALAQAKQAGEQKKHDNGEPLGGYVITLDIPSYIAVMTYAEDRNLREEVYRAFVTRASAEGLKADGSSAACWDNTGLISEILALRHEKAHLLGFDNFAELSLAKKMADSPEQVLGFLTELAEKSRPFAERDYNELQGFAREQGCDELAAWDLAFYSEKLRQQKYAISQEELKPYFPAEKVINGMFEVVKRLFAIDVLPVAAFDSWHPDVRFYHIFRDGEQIASFYLDIFAREHKQGGAW